MTDDWGTKHNGCRVGLRFTDSMEFSADGSQARIHDFDLMFSSDDPIYDTSNNLYTSGNAITDGGAWANEVNKSSSWSGTMTMRTQSGQWNTLDYGATQNHDATVKLTGISYAGSDLTSTHTFTYPARAYSVPAAGSTPVIASATATSATITWSFPSATFSTGAAPVISSMLQYSTATLGWTNLASIGHATPSSIDTYTHTGLTPGTQYYYRTLGYNSSGYGAVSGTSSGVWTTPTAATIGTATRASDTAITMNWTNNHSGRTSASVNYLYYNVDGGAWVYIGYVAATTTSYTWTGGSANHYYSFLVQAANAYSSANSAGSNIIANSISAPSLSTGAATVTTPHSTAYDTIKQTSQAVFTWTHSAPTYVQAYEVYLNGAKYGADVVGTTVTITGLVAGSSNNVYVTAKRTSAPTGISGNSNTLNTTIGNVLTAPAGVTLGAFTANGGKASATLSWGAVAGATSYYVAKLSGGSVTGIGVVVGTSVALTLMDPDTAYQFTVYTLNDVGYSLGTNSQAGTVTPSAPDAPASVDVDYVGGILSLVWTAPASNGGSAITAYQYKIEHQDSVGGAWILDNDWAALGLVNTLSIAKDTVYSYRASVRAINGIGAGTESYAETGVIGGYLRIIGAGATTSDVFVKKFVDAATTTTALVRKFDGTTWVPLTYA